MLTVMESCCSLTCSVMCMAWGFSPASLKQAGLDRSHLPSLEVFKRYIDEVLSDVV